MEKYKNMPELEIVSGKKYKKGAVVEIDGKSFSGCTFTECTIRFGGGNFEIFGCGFVNLENVQLFDCAQHTVAFIEFIRRR